MKEEILEKHEEERREMQFEPTVDVLEESQEVRSPYLTTLSYLALPLVSYPFSLLPFPLPMLVLSLTYPKCLH